ncbi:hypothetical protein [Aquincola sp. J276]|uniref:hypothetical protein n=1 Tax=Aquincola sp. J276 TaxID=2898432 RepID=UPI002151EE22|nr:hypothetical protein [Aquincola sp. J276]MCR5865668.1 hypothetical protein [Aquincola sp. J276]
MKKHLCAVWALACSAVVTQARAVLNNKLVAGAAVLAAATLAKSAHEHFNAEADQLKAKQAATETRLLRYNEGHEANFANIVERARAISTDGIPQLQLRKLCGPAALYVTLGQFAPQEAFARFVKGGLQAGWFEMGLRQGTGARGLSEALELQGLESEILRFSFKEETARQAVIAVDEGKAVFAEVNGSETYFALTGQPLNVGRHIVGVVAIRRGAQGAVTGVGLYDVNVYRPQSDVPLRFVPYKTFVSTLRFAQDGLFPGLVVSKSPVRAPVQL